jgi:hypothetical protein
MNDMSDKKVKEEPTEDAQPLGPTLTLADRNDYLGFFDGDATGHRNPRRITECFKSVSSHLGDVNTAAVDNNDNTKSDATDVIAILDDDGESSFMLRVREEDSHNDAIDGEADYEVDEVDQEKKPPPTKHRATSQGQNRKDTTFDDVLTILSDEEEEATDNDSTDDDEDYESDEEKEPLPTKRKAKSRGHNRQGVIANNRSRKPPPAQATAAGNKYGSATITPIIYLGGYKTASREYKEYMHFLAINRKGNPWTSRHYDRLRNRFSGHDFVLTKGDQETKAKKPDIMKSAAQMYKTILKKLSHGQEQVTKKRPTAATRQHTAPAPVASVARVADATPMDDEIEDIGNFVSTFVSELRTRKEAAFNSEDDDICAKGLKIKQFITHVEKGRATLSL